jgi:hypothetical protein
MRENLTTIDRELGGVPPRVSLTESLARNFEKLLGTLPRAGVDEELREEASRLEAEFLTEEWLHRIGRPTRGRTVKIAAGVEVKHLVHKAPGGLIRGDVEIADGVISSLVVSGDFFFYPAEKLMDLSDALVGIKTKYAEETIHEFYRKHGIESPGVEPADFAKVVVG